jgi:hypothetical protein
VNQKQGFFPPWVVVEGSSLSQSSGSPLESLEVGSTVTDPKLNEKQDSKGPKQTLLEVAESPKPDETLPSSTNTDLDPKLNEKRDSNGPKQTLVKFAESPKADETSPSFTNTDLERQVGLSSNSPKEESSEQSQNDSAKSEKNGNNEWPDMRSALKKVASGTAATSVSPLDTGQPRVAQTNSSGRNHVSPSPSSSAESAKLSHGPGSSDENQPFVKCSGNETKTTTSIETTKSSGSARSEEGKSLKNDAGASNGGDDHAKQESKIITFQPTSPDSSVTHGSPKQSPKDTTSLDNASPQSSQEPAKKKSKVL